MTVLSIMSDDPYPMGRLALAQPHHAQQPRRHRRMRPLHPDAGSFTRWSFQKYASMSCTHSKYDTTTPPEIANMSGTTRTPAR